MTDSRDFQKRFDALQLQAEHDLAKALLDRDEQPTTTRKRRITLADIEDVETDSKVTVVIQQQAPPPAHRQELAQGDVELSTPSGYKFRGPLMAFALLLATVGLIWWLLHR